MVFVQKGASYHKLNKSCISIIQRCSLENHKGTIPVQSLYCDSTLLVLNGTSLNNDSALLDILQYHQLRARRALSLFKDVPLRTRRALSLYKVYGDSALLVLNRTSLNK